MLRRLFALLAILSLFLFLGSGAMWVRSYQKILQLDRSFRFADCWLDSNDGAVIAHASWLKPELPQPSGVLEPVIAVQQFSPTLRLQWAADRRIEIPGLEFTQGIEDHGILIMGVLPPIHEPGNRWSQLSVRWWLIALLSSFFPAFWWWRWQARRGREVGLCASCGYDLRATPNRCPECGTARPQTN